VKTLNIFCIISWDGFCCQKILKIPISNQRIAATELDHNTIIDLQGTQANIAFGLKSDNI
jgi:hypothetical protein